MRIGITLMLLVFTFSIFAQDSTTNTALDGSSTPYFSLILSGLVLLILLSGIIVQARWRDK